MASLREILERGLSDYLDDKYPDPEPSTTPPKPEQSAPRPNDPAGIEPTLLASINRGVMSLTQEQILAVTLITVGILAVVHFVRK